VLAAVALTLASFGPILAPASTASAAISHNRMPNLNHGHLWYSVRPARFSTQNVYHYRYLRWSRWGTTARATGQQHLFCLGAGHCSRGWHNNVVTITLSKVQHGSFTTMRIYYQAAHVSVTEHFHYSGRLRGWY